MGRVTKFAKFLYLKIIRLQRSGKILKNIFVVKKKLWGGGGGSGNTFFFYIFLLVGLK